MATGVLAVDTGAAQGDERVDGGLWQEVAWLRLHEIDARWGMKGVFCWDVVYTTVLGNSPEDLAELRSVYRAETGAHREGGLIHYFTNPPTIGSLPALGSLCGEWIVLLETLARYESKRTSTELGASVWYESAPAITWSPAELVRQVWRVLREHPQTPPPQPLALDTFDSAVTALDTVIRFIGTVQNAGEQARGRELAGDSTPDTPVGFLGGAALAEALEVAPARRGAFFQRLMRERKVLGDDCWREVLDPRPNSPRFLYRVDSPKLRDLAAACKRPRPA